MVHSAMLNAYGISGDGLGLEFQEFLWQLVMIVWLERWGNGVIRRGNGGSSRVAGGLAGLRSIQE